MIRTFVLHHFLIKLMTWFSLKTHQSYCWPIYFIFFFSKQGFSKKMGSVNITYNPIWAPKHRDKFQKNLIANSEKNSRQMNGATNKYNFIGPLWPLPGGWGVRVIIYSNNNNNIKIINKSNNKNNDSIVIFNNNISSLITF